MTLRLAKTSIKEKKAVLSMNDAKKKSSVFKQKYIYIAILISAFFTAVIILGILFIDNKNIDYQKIDINYSGFSFKAELEANTVFQELDNVNKTSNHFSNQLKILHLSDTHFPNIKINLNNFFSRISEEKPDIIVITGDMIDDNADVEQSGVSEFIERLSPLSKVFYVCGNHEGRNKDSELLFKMLKNAGITVLMNEYECIDIRNIKVAVIGLADNAEYSEVLAQNEDFKGLPLNAFRVLIAHRPEKWQSYIAENHLKPHLVFAGHAHGGQFRFFGKGLIAPNQGLFPKLSSGLYSEKGGNANLIVSRGLGNSFFPFRFNNKPHVPIVNVSFKGLS